MGSGPLSGIRVVEICSWHTGPAAAAILGDQGADVIKVEAPGGDEYRHAGPSRAGYSAMFMAANRNKRSITLDLKAPAQRDVLMQIIAKSDVLIQNQRPGVMERLGLGAEALREQFPRLIYASISGYGRTGPKASERAFDTMMQALTGMAAVQADPDGRPRMIRTMLPDKVTSPIVAQAICAALFQRERTGAGAAIDYAMLDAMVWWMWPDAMTNETFIGDDTKGSAAFAEADFIAETSDGFMVVTPHQETSWQNFTRLVGKPEWQTDPRFSPIGKRMRNFAEYSAAVSGSLRDKSTAEWSALFAENDIPYAPVLRIDQVAEEPQVVWNDVIEEVEHPAAGRYRSPRSPVLFDGMRNGVLRHVPAAGADTDEVLRELGIQSAAVNALSA